MRAPIRLLFAVTLGSSTALAAQSRDWTPDERTVLSDYTEIRAVAVTTERVFAISNTGVIAWNTLRRNWEGPYLPRDPGALREVVAAIADPLDHTVWMIRRNGWVRFDPALQQFEVGFIPGTVSDAALDRNSPASGLFLRSGSQWFQASRGGSAIPSSAPQAPVRPATVQEAIRDNPSIQASTSAFLGNTRLRPVHYTSAARAEAFAGQGWFLGSNVAGLIFFPLGAGVGQQFAFGLPSDLALAVTVSGDDVWVVNGRTTVTDPSVTRLARDLSSVAWMQGPRATGLPFGTARRIVSDGTTLWLATDQGVLRVTPSTDPEIRDYQRELPDIPVLDLAQQGGRIGIGMEHGVAVHEREGGMRRYAMNFAEPAPAVLPGGDTLWIGTRLGLWFADSSMADVRRPAGFGDAPSQQEPIIDLVWRADTLVALTRSRLIWRDPASGSFTLGPDLGRSVGRLLRLVNGRDALYIAGTSGVGVIRLKTPILRTFPAPGDIPGEVTDIAVDQEYLWVTSRRGLVRFSLDAIGR